VPEVLEYELEDELYPPYGLSEAELPEYPLELMRSCPPKLVLLEGVESLIPVPVTLESLTLLSFD